MSKPSPSPPQYLEVHCRSSGRTLRFAPGTESGFALSLINRNLRGTLRVPTHIEAVKDGEEPIAFGPNSILSHIGEGWKLQTVSFTQLPSEDARNRHVRGMATQTPGLKKNNKQPQRPVFIADDSHQLFHLRRVHSEDGSFASTSSSSPATTTFSTSAMAKNRAGPRPTASNRAVRHGSRLLGDPEAQQEDEQPQQEPQPQPQQVLQPEEEQPQQEPQTQPVEQHIPAVHDAAVERFLGGPADTSVLRTYADHVATRLWDGLDREELRLFSHGKKVKDLVIRHDEVRQRVQGSGLEPLLTCSHELVDKGLVSAFVERWHRDTNSFHLPVGEMTITLDDVSSLLHIPITGAFLTITVFDKAQAAVLLRELLGVTVAESRLEMDNVTRSPTVRYSWLLDRYHARCEQERWDEAARALLLFLVGCTLFSDKSSLAVSVAYLECFRDLQSCGAYSWGAAALAHLYDNLREASLHHTRGISGYLTLLQAWVYEHFPSLCTGCATLRDEYEEKEPRAFRWKPRRDRGLVGPFREGLDALTEDQVCWTPYDEHRAARPFEEASLFRGWIRWGPKMYAHLPDRVLRQFGYVQTIPSSPADVTSVTTTPKQVDIAFTQYVVHLVDPGSPVVHPYDCVDGYMDWFRRISHPYIIYRDPAPAPAPDPAVPVPAPNPAVPAPRVVDEHMIEIMQTLLDRQFIVPDGVPLAMELMARMTGAPVEVKRTSGGVAVGQKYRRQKRPRPTY